MNTGHSTKYLKYNCLKIFKIYNIWQRIAITKFIIACLLRMQRCAVVYWEGGGGGIIQDWSIIIDTWAKLWIR